MTDDIATEALGRLRSRLLDLSRRNALLNYKERRQDLRIVDELPDITYRRLRDGETFSLKPIEPPADESDELDNDSGAGATAGSAAKDEGPPANPSPAEGESPTEPEGDGPNLGPELPPQTDSFEERHVDDALQTPFEPKALETRARKLRETARAAIEETGANFLFLIIGFLEWYESESSDVKMRAPLVIVPVEIKKGKFNNRLDAFDYTIEYRDEDIETNLSLVEKLKINFGIDLPDFNEDLSPDQYLESIQVLIAKIPKWRVAREMMVGLFSFSKILMYRDLDPERWPEGKGPLHHPTARTIFGGGSERESGSPLGLIDSYDQDRDDSVPDLPLILDADSSQYSVIASTLSTEKADSSCMARLERGSRRQSPT